MKNIETKKPKRVRQHIGKDAVIVPLLEEEDHKEIVEEVQKHEKKALETKKVMNKKCIMCGEEATHQVKNQPTMCYCKQCGKEQFKYLNYLEKL